MGSGCEHILGRASRATAREGSSGVRHYLPSSSPHPLNLWKLKASSLAFPLSTKLVLPTRGHMLTLTLGWTQSRLHSGQPQVSCQATDVNVGSKQGLGPYAVLFLHR